VQVGVAELQTVLAIATAILDTKGQIAARAFSELVEVLVPKSEVGSEVGLDLPLVQNIAEVLDLLLCPGWFPGRTAGSIRLVRHEVRDAGVSDAIAGRIDQAEYYTPEFYARLPGVVSANCREIVHDGFRQPVPSLGLVTCRRRQAAADADRHGQRRRRQ